MPTIYKNEDELQRAVFSYLKQQRINRNIATEVACPAGGRADIVVFTPSNFVEELIEVKLQPSIGAIGQLLMYSIGWKRHKTITLTIALPGPKDIAVASRFEEKCSMADVRVWWFEAPEPATNHEYSSECCYECCKGKSKAEAAVKAAANVEATKVAAKAKAARAEATRAEAAKAKAARAEASKDKAARAKATKTEEARAVVDPREKQLLEYILSGAYPLKPSYSGKKRTS